MNRVIRISLTIILMVWSITQVLSFIPNFIGQLAGVLGLALFIIHWVFIRKIIKLLA